MPNRKIRMHSQVLVLEASTLEPHAVHTHRAHGLPRKCESGTVEKGKTVRWTQTTQLSRPMAGPVLPCLPTALQLNRAPVALSLAGRLSRRDDGGWGSRGLLELLRPTVRTPITITITAPLPCTYTPSYSQSPTRRGVGPSCVGWPSPWSSCAQCSKHVSARDTCTLFCALHVLCMIRSYLAIKCLLSSNPSTSLHVNSCHTILTVNVSWRFPSSLSHRIRKVPCVPALAFQHPSLEDSAWALLWCGPQADIRRAHPQVSACPETRHVARPLLRLPCCSYQTKHSRDHL
jgi:hypothetical protein